MRAWCCLFISKVMCTKGIYSQVSTETLDLDQHSIYSPLGVGLYSVHAYQLVNTQSAKYWLPVDKVPIWMLIEYQLRCRSRVLIESINWYSTMGALALGRMISFILFRVHIDLFRLIDWYGHLSIMTCASFPWPCLNGKIHVGLFNWSPDITCTYQNLVTYFESSLAKCETQQTCKQIKLGSIMSEKIHLSYGHKFIIP